MNITTKKELVKKTGLGSTWKNVLRTSPLCYCANSESYYNANKKKALQHNNTRTRGFQKSQVGSNDGEFCGNGLEPHKDRRSRWVLLV